MKKILLSVMLLPLAACGDSMSFQSADSAWGDIDYSAYERTLARAPIQNGKPVYIKAISLTGGSTTSLPAGGQY